MLSCPRKLGDIQSVHKNRPKMFFSLKSRNKKFHQVCVCVWGGMGVCGCGVCVCVGGCVFCFVFVFCLFLLNKLGIGTLNLNTKFGAYIMYNIYNMANGNFVGFHQPQERNLKDYPCRCDTLKWRFICVKRDKNDVEMITRNHFLLI